VDRVGSIPSLLRQRSGLPWSGRDQLVFCVGLAKSGTHSIADMLAGSCRSAHEPDPYPLLEMIPRVRAGKLSTGRLGPFFLERRRRLGLQFESSHLLSSFTPHLVEIFPGARFILLVRDCRSWIDSMINDQLNMQGWDGYPPWHAMYDAYLDRSTRDFPEPEQILADLDLYPLRNYVAYWRSEAEAITSCVPRERLLTVRTEELSSSLPAIADFFGVPVYGLSAQHSYQSWRKHDVLARIDSAYVGSLIEAGI
jgi:Sulfotransferase domain